MKVLVTGVAGFIGSNLASALLHAGHEVVGFDNMSQGHPLNLEPLLKSPAFRMVYADLKELETLKEAIKGCRVVYHLAAYKIPRYSDALDTLLINTQGSENVLKAACDADCKVVAASTSDVYGKNPKVPFKETSEMVIGDPTVRRWSYAISKMFEEQLLFAYGERFGLDFTIVRFFGGYGPNQNLTWWGGPQSVFINCALDGKEMEVHGDGAQTRSFTYVSDHVVGLLRMLDTPKSSKEVFNIGAVREISIKDLALSIWRMVRPSEEPKLKVVPYSNFGKYEDVMRRVPDISKARELLGFEPKVDLENGLRTTIRWQIERRKSLGIETGSFNL